MEEEEYEIDESDTSLSEQGNDHQQAVAVNALIDTLHSAHLDNAKLQYYAERIDGGRISQMPATPFVYEFFLFNSIYQIDWEKTREKGRLEFHTREQPSESQQQKDLIGYLEKQAKPEQLVRAFDLLRDIDLTEAAWMQVTPDSRISIRDGKRFFCKLRELQTLLINCNNPSELSISDRFFPPLKKCVYFVYSVRNNIFHGSKTLGEISEQNQRRRIEIYDLFLKCVTSLFFLVSGKNEAGCDFVPCPIYALSLPTNTNGEVVGQALILRAIREKLMKIGDARLISRFTKLLLPPEVAKIPGEKASLFYPSAGKDFFTPILLGLPYCTQFYFLEENNLDKKYLTRLFNILKGVNGVCVTTRMPLWELRDDRHYLDFEFNDIPRRIHWVHADNTSFFAEDAELKFYFHRGDSWGEGGSGQEWDSKLLPELLKKIPEGSSCLYLTDGSPSGFDESYASETTDLNMPFIERGRKYYCGRF